MTHNEARSAVRGLADFRSWLELQLGRGDPVGELARSVAADRVERTGPLALGPALSQWHAGMGAEAPGCIMCGGPALPRDRVLVLSTTGVAIFHLRCRRVFELAYET